jgi:hypothetical protein
VEQCFDPCLSRPSEKALGLAEELLDYVHPGMTRAAAIREMAMLIDGMNEELVQMAATLVNAAQPEERGRLATLMGRLQAILAEYEPLHAALQEESYPSVRTATAGAVAGPRA